MESEKKHLGDIWGIKRRDRNEKVFARPNGPRPNAGKNRFRVGDLDLPQRRKRYVYTSSREEEEEIDAQVRPRGKAIPGRE